MLFPIRCFTCGKPIGHLWEKYKELLKKGLKPAEALEKLGIKRYCCRQIFLTHVDFFERIMRYRRV